MTREDYVFFWKISEVHGWASQWYPSTFSATIQLDGKEELASFPTAEHWMMVQKALLFSDYAMARTMLAITGVTSDDLTRVKALGRKVERFDDDVWKQAREEIVLLGNLHKFRQNEELKEKLFATGDKMLIEASPRDRIWGIGFGEKNAMNQKERWGLNLLGKALVDTRNRLRLE